MILLEYCQNLDQVWVCCSYNEAEELLIPFMEPHNIHEYLKSKKYKKNHLERGENYCKSIMNMYGLNEVPDVFALIGRDMKVTIIDDPFFPHCAIVGEGMFCECDHIRIASPKQMKRLCITHNDGDPFPNQPAHQKLFFDMDGTLVDFESGVRWVAPETLAEHQEHPEDIEGIFSLMEPMEGAVEAVKSLSQCYDCYILSTAPWDNESAWSDKVAWVKRYMGDIFHKKVILTHHKELFNGGDNLLIDDKPFHGADSFGDNLIEFNGNWSEVTDKLCRRAYEEGAGVRY